MICVLLDHATFELVVAAGRIRLAPPIARWTRGRPACGVWDYYAARSRVGWMP